MLITIEVFQSLYSLTSVLHTSLGENAQVRYSEVCVITLGYKNHKSCKILPKFSSALHFLQESYKFVQE